MRWDFTADPSPAGWATGAPTGARPGGSWSPEGHLIVRGGWWAGPPVAVEPFGYYRLSFRSRGAHPGFCFVEFQSPDGEALAADCCDGIEPSADWIGRELVFRAHASAGRAFVRFQDRSGEFLVGDVSIERVGAREAEAWLEELSRALPVYECRFDAGRWRRLPETLQRLRAGGTLRIVLLGDSIVNDAANSLFEVLLKRTSPRTDIRVVSSVRSSTGCWYYKDEDRVREYVLQYEPDLVIIGGISHRGDAEAVRSVVRQIRALGRAEIVLMTGAVGPCDFEKESAYGSSLARVAEEEGAAFLDLRAAWDEQMAAASRSSPGAGAACPAERFRRDPIHANSLGKAALGRILAAFLAPPP